MATDQDGTAVEEQEHPSFTEEDRTPVEEMTTLGLCHYCQEHAVRIAAHKDGTGWIAICDEHDKQARDDDFEPAKDS